MKQKAYDGIKKTELFGRLVENQNKFDDSNYFTIDNIFKYKLSKINFFLGKKNGKEVIYGLQTFYKTKDGQEISSKEYIDKKEEKEDLYVKTFLLRSCDYIREISLHVYDGRITNIGLTTKEHKYFRVGNDEGKGIYLDFENYSNTQNILLYFFGFYRNYLEAIAFAYIPNSLFLWKYRGYFELRVKLQNNQDFKNAILAKYEQLNESDKALYKTCCLYYLTFDCIMKYVLDYFW